MKPETLTALQGSIAKWQAIVDGTGEDQGADNCPLCLRFQESGETCTTRSRERCPVAIATERVLCVRSPYDKWSDLFRDGIDSYIADTPERKAAAQAELAFLQSLLPNPER